MTDTPTRFAFDRAKAEPILRTVQEAATDWQWDRVTGLLTPEQITDAQNIGLDGFRPDTDSEINSAVGALIDLAMSTGWLTGPARPLFEQTDHDGMCSIAWELFLSDEARVPLTLGWQDTCDLIDFADTDERDEHGGFIRNTGADAALDLLANMVVQMNGAMAGFDGYVAAQIAAQPDPYSALINAVTTEFESEVVEELQIKAGLLWKCPVEGYNNTPDAETCEGCGAAHPDADTKVA